MSMKLFLSSLSLLLMLCSAQATWFGENVEDGADIMMMDLRYPWWAESTYNAHWNFAFNAPDNFSGYGGFTMGVTSQAADHAPNFDPETQAAFRPGAVWSFWGSNAKGEPARVVATSEFNYPRQYIGEGASGALGGPCWPVISQARWYTMLLRVWQPIGVEDPQCAYVGRWVKDVEAGRWYLYGVVRLPTPATSFRGNAGFLEDFVFAGRSVRSVHRRRGYYRREGTWKSSDTVSYNVPLRDTFWVVEKLEDETVLAMELSGDRSLLPQRLTGEILESGKSHAFTVKQPKHPILDQPAITQVTARSDGKQLLVSWVVPDSAAPQLQYNVEVFDNPQCENEPIVVRKERMPHTRAVLLEADIDSPTVRVSVTDVFDQKAEPVVVRAEQATVPTAPVSVKTAPGLLYELLLKDSARHVNVLYPPCAKGEQNREEKHYWVSLDEMNEGRLAQQGITHGFNVDLRGNRQHGYAFRFRGLLRVPRSGIYLFHMKGTDGYRIAVDGREALTWDGLHGPAEKTFALDLAGGDHPLAVDYFVDKQQPFFGLEWEGPGLAREPIPRAALLHRDTGDIPTAALAAESVKEGVVSVACEVEPNGGDIDRIQLFLGNMQVATSTSNALHYTGLLPAGSHTLWARVWYDNNHTVDSETIPITIDAAAMAGWKLGVAGEKMATRNVQQTAPDALAFVGEGEYVVYRDIEGDFTLTCRVDTCLGLNGEPVNGASWVGLTVRERAGANSYRWGREFGVLQTARYGLRTTPDWSDGGASRLSVQRLPEGCPWLRVVRQGALWTAWTSVDGIAWECGAIHHKPLNEAVGAGVVFRALPQDAQMYFRAAISSLSLVAGVPKDFRLPDATPATATAQVDLTGVVVAPSDPQIIVVRSSTRGVLRSVDGGATWRPANGKLSGPANAVRSVAIHPTDPRIMLRAAGQAGDKAGGGLYRTGNGGGSWDRIAFPGDFDGMGPSALCGEIIAYHPNRPEVILVGCETRGLFRSEDGGTSWQRVLAAGERFTAVKFHPMDFKQNGDAVVHAVTCPDRLMPILGRGETGATNSVVTSRDYMSHDSGNHFAKQCDRSDLGLLNLTFSDPLHGTFELGSTHGVLHTFSAGRESYLFSTGVAVESLRPITALGAGWIKDQSWPCVYAQALSPAVPGQISRCDYARDIRWQWASYPGLLSAGAVAVSPCDVKRSALGHCWWFLALDGLYRLDHRSKSFTRMLE